MYLLYIVYTFFFFYFFFFFLVHPLFMSLMILSQSILVGLIIYLYNSISWFSYLLFMIFLSGTMIILVYVSSLASNILMKYFLLNLKTFMMLLILLIILSFLSSKVSIFYNNNDNFSNLSNMIVMAGKIYSKENYLFTVLIMCYLLVVLILVVKNSLLTKGPLRSYT
uniref:NADH dehydrogenase subunit 6 n=1 Tax=Metacrangonyx goulmimensis TaxID=1199162 RepID=K7ZVL9_9CRUS|nr:NADH dehydrogenase subunit 6 [Metacrangonyx goulmimensis]